VNIFSDFIFSDFYGRQESEAPASAGEPELSMKCIAFFCRFRLVFSFTGGALEEPRRNGQRNRTEAEGAWQGVSESAVSAKRGWGSFGAKPAQFETPVRAASTGRGRSEKKMA
jgi:hypothetical protein